MDSSQPRICPFEEADADAVVSLSLRAWEPVFVSIEQAMTPEVFRALHPDWRVSQQQAVEDVLASQKTQVWVAEVNESSVVGFVAIELNHPESGMGEVYMVAVDPDYQGSGIGSALNEFALARIKDAGMKVAMVETGGDSGHAAARRTYEKAGYVHVPVSRYFKKL